MVCPQCSASLPPGSKFCTGCNTKAPKPLPTDALLGRVLEEKYKILRRIGVGSAGAVYEAEHLLLECKVALKVLHLGPGQLSEEIVERFRREAIAASRLRHPYAVKLFDRGETEEGFLWIAMELLEGEPLSARLERGALFSEEELAELFVPLCEVLEEAHQKGIVHRDVKPQNIMLVTGSGGKPLARITDFGMAGLQDAKDLTRPNLVSGTPRYMAPEQWKGLTHADARSDVYSLGVTAFQCLSGALPLDADTPLAWLRKHQREEPLDIREAMRNRPLSEGVAEAIRSTLSKDPAARPQTAKAFSRALSEGALARRAPLSPKQKEEPTLLPAATPKTQTSITVRPGRRGIYWRAAAALALLLGAAGVSATGLLDGASPVPPPVIPTARAAQFTTRSPRSAPTESVPEEPAPEAPLPASHEEKKASAPPKKRAASSGRREAVSSASGEKKEEAPPSLKNPELDTINPWEHP